MMKNVLLVDDDQIDNFLSSRMLELVATGVSIHVSQNGKEALEFLKQNAAGNSPMPDLVLLDLNMPVMNGFDFMQSFNSMSLPGKDAIRIVALSSSDNVNDVDRIKSLGAKFYLSKPLAEENLRKVLPQ